MPRSPYALLLFALTACTEQPPPTDGGAASAPVTASAPAAPAVASASAAPSATPAKAKPHLDADGFGKLVERLSEPKGEFFSDNFISNETSYLQATKLLESRPKGGVYVGVGPEQNFTYIAQTEPELAFIVDVRRDNLVLHLMYKALFELADDRADFLALLTGRPHEGEGPGADADIAAILDHVAGLEATEETFRAAHEAVKAQIAEGSGVTLTKSDDKSLREAHRAFFEDGVDIRFELKQNSFRKYPSLRELALQTSPEGKRAGFLADPDAFATVQRMQRENRIVPMVGNFGGDHALAELGTYLEEEKQTLRSFYVSNVEQYLMVDGLWWKWKRNIEGLPTDDDSVFIRCYLDQGKPHPSQMKGHRTATVVQRVADFEAQQRAPRSLLALSSHKTIAAK